MGISLRTLGRFDDRNFYERSLNKNCKIIENRAALHPRRKRKSNTKTMNGQPPCDEDREGNSHVMRFLPGHFM